MKEKLIYLAVCTLISIGAFVYAQITGKKSANMVGVITVVYGVLIVLSGVWEKYATKRFIKFRQQYKYENKSISGREENHGANPLKKHGSSMKSDMTYRYRAYHTAVALLCSFLFFVLLITTPNAPLRGKIAALLVVGGSLGYGMYRFFAVPVRRFYKKLGESADLISEDYMDGSLFVKGKEGINIGRRYIVKFTGSNVCMTETSNVRMVVVKPVNQKQVYKNIYLYSVIDYEIIVIFKEQRKVKDNIKDTKFSVALNKKQADAALSEFKIMGIKVFDIGDKDMVLEFIKGK